MERVAFQRGADLPDRAASSIAMFAAPLLFALSSFYWTGDGQYGLTGSTLLVFGSIAWIIAFVAVFRALRDVTPRYAVWGLVVAVYGTVCGGAAFAFQGLFTALYAIPHDRMLRGLAEHPIVANAIFWIGGPAFPLTLVVLGIVLARTRRITPWLGFLLALGGALFPVARIPRLAGIAHAVDVMMLVPLWALGVRTWTSGLRPR